MVFETGDGGVMQLFNFEDGALALIGEEFSVDDDIENLSWCDEAQTLTVRSKSGSILGLTDDSSTNRYFRGSSLILHDNFKSNLAYTASDKEVLVVDTKTQNPIKSFQVHRGPVISLALTKSYIGIATINCLVQVYSIKTTGMKVFVEYQFHEEVKVSRAANQKINCSIF